MNIFFWYSKDCNLKQVVNFSHLYLNKKTFNSSYRITGSLLKFQRYEKYPKKCWEKLPWKVQYNFCRKKYNFLYGFVAFHKKISFLTSILQFYSDVLNWSETNSSRGITVLLSLSLKNVIIIPAINFDEKSIKHWTARRRIFLWRIVRRESATFWTTFVWQRSPVLVCLCSKRTKKVVQKLSLSMKQ